MISPPEIFVTLPAEVYVSELKFQMPILPAVIAPPQISSMVPQFWIQDSSLEEKVPPLILVIVPSFLKAIKPSCLNVPPEISSMVPQLENKEENLPMARKSPAEILLIFAFRSVYKELHADRETGC